MRYGMQNVAVDGGCQRTASKVTDGVFAQHVIKERTNGHAQCPRP